MSKKSENVVRGTLSRTDPTTDPVRPDADKIHHPTNQAADVIPAVNDNKAYQRDRRNHPAGQKYDSTSLAKQGSGQ
jgi:hypothetical protein